MAVIKRQLDKLLPAAKVFLDVDDLDDLTKLEEYVRASGLIGVFLSRGYFLSGEDHTSLIDQL